MILKKGLLTELEKKKDSKKGNNFFWVGPVLGGSVGAWQTNIFLRSAQRIKVQIRLRISAVLSATLLFLTSVESASSTYVEAASQSLHFWFTEYTGNPNDRFSLI